MASIVLDDSISKEELNKWREKFVNSDIHDVNIQFQYALCLVRSKESSDIKNGLQLFQKIFDSTKDDNLKRDSLYYMAVGEAKLKNYEPSLKYLQKILNVETTNEQVRDLYIEVNKRMRKDGLLGIGIVAGSAAVGLAGLAALGIAMITKKS
jgi:mitochondrial fission 1 protein